MRFSDFDVMVMAGHVVLTCYVDGEKASGAKLQIDCQVPSASLAAYDELFQRLAALGNMYQDTPTDVLTATNLLTKGSNYERDES